MFKINQLVRTKVKKDFVPIGTVTKITGVDISTESSRVEGGNWYQNSDLEAATPFNTGDIITNRLCEKKVLEAFENFCVLTYSNDFSKVDFSYTYAQLSSYHKKEESKEVETIEIDGKKYDAEKVRERLDELEKL